MSRRTLILLGVGMIIVLIIISLATKIATRPAPTSGILHVTVAPGDAEIAIDGQPTQIGPDLTLSLPVGAHQVTTSRGGYQTQNNAATITGGKTTNLSVNMLAITSTSAATGTTPAHAEDKTAAIQKAINPGGQNQPYFEYQELRSFSNDAWVVGKANNPSTDSALVVLRRTGNSYQTVFLGTSMGDTDYSTWPPEVINYLKQLGYL